MRLSTVLASVFMVGLVTGCGSPISAVSTGGQSQAKTSPPAQSTTTYRSSLPPVLAHTACYPAWERRDIVVAARTQLPVPTTTITANIGNGPGLTAKTLAEWFGKPFNTPLTPGALLQGWSIQDSMASSPIGHIELLPAGNGPVSYGYSGFNIVLAERQPTPEQASLLKGAGMLTPITLLIQISRLGSSTSLEAAMQYMVDQIKSGAELPMTIAMTVSQPDPTRYLSYAGPIQPKTLLMSTGGCPLRDVGWVLGMQKGLIVPIMAPFATDANGIRLGFAAGAVILDDNQAGYDTVQWFKEPGISVPPKS